MSHVDLLYILLYTLGVLAAAFAGFTIWVVARYGKYIIKVFEHTPLLVPEPIPPVPGAEPIEFTGPGGRVLRGSYLRCQSPTRRGVVLFGHEYNGDRWFCNAYAGPLREFGYDVCSFDFCCHGESDRIRDYAPQQWITEHEVADMTAAIEYMKRRPDADPRGLVLFGVSKGGSAAIAAAARDPYARIVVTDGAYPNHGTVIDYERRWVSIFTRTKFIYSVLPRWFYSLLCEVTLFRQERKHGVKYVRMEREIRRYGRRPLFMIHGEKDGHIKEPIAERFFAEADQANKEFWMVPGAKHNRCLETAGAEYHRRILAFIDRHATVTLLVAAAKAAPIVIHAAAQPAGA